MGAAIAFAAALVATLRLAAGATPPVKVTLVVVLTLIGGSAMTGAVLMLEYRIYYSQWHAPPLTRVWIWQQAFTAAGALYQYAVMGLRYYSIGALAVLLGMSWWVVRSFR